MKLITFFGLFILLAGNGLAQKVIVIDTIKDDKILKARFGTPVYFRFNNVNPLYTDSITITSIAFNFSGDVPAVFSGANTNVGADKENATENKMQEIADIIEEFKKKIRSFSHALKTSAKPLTHSERN